MRNISFNDGREFYYFGGLDIDNNWQLDLGFFPVSHFQYKPVFEQWKVLYFCQQKVVRAIYFRFLGLSVRWSYSAGKLNTIDYSTISGMKVKSFIFDEC